MTQRTDREALEASVKLVAEPWADSSYYADAERATDSFWDEGTEFRRLFDCLAVDTVLELACGHGRHSERLARITSTLILVDVFERNLDVCRERLDQHENVRYVKGTGYDFRPIHDGSVDSVVCYDAMVHFSADIVGSYLRDGRRILRKNGQMLLHHSNYDTKGNDRHYGLNPHARNHMTYDLFRSLANQASLTIVSSVALDWGEHEALDRLSLLASR